STLDHVRVPIFADRARGGELEIAFAPLGPSELREWLLEPTSLLVVGFCVGGALLFYPYLRRALHLLDPSVAVPDRVRKAFDALSGGVVVVDPHGRIVLANKSFRRLHPHGSSELHGRKLSELAWLNDSKEGDASSTSPWVEVFRDGKPLTGYPLSIAQPDRPPIETIVGCSPICDNDNRVRGCLITFDDVTEIHLANEQLLSALADLEDSRQKIQAQNEELQRLATRDPLTGCLNRRAFFERAGPLFDDRVRRNGELCCIMTDIDHFKGFNDLYGHAVGDQVIQVVAGTLSRGLRSSEQLCRYGGEEFLIILPDVALEEAADIAERLRTGVEQTARSALRSTRVERVTASFGVASLSQGAVRLEELIDQADNALYKSKENGRNRVTVWRPAED